MRRARTMAAGLCAAGLCAAGLCGQTARAQLRRVELLPGRDFGYVPGDLITRSAEIDVARGSVLDAASLPSPGPLGASIDLRRIDVSRRSLGDGERYTLRCVYQSFYAPEQVGSADVPGYGVAFSQGGARFGATVPGFTFTASPFRHDLQPVLDASVLRPDHADAPMDTAGPRRLLRGGGAMAALGLAGLVAGIVADRRARGPFATAARLIAALPDDAQGVRDAMLALHRAFDDTAGRRVLAGDMDAFLSRHASFQPARAGIETFFAASRDLFFGQGTCVGLRALAGLSGALRRAERRA